jgi:uncharacterized repeat protein (TIGR01451 family)
MATTYGTNLQGDTISFTVNATNFGTIDSLTVEVFKDNVTVVKFKDPAATGFLALVKAGANYTGVILPATSLLMEGMYGIELTATNGTVVQKAKNDTFILINKEAS